MTLIAGQILQSRYRVISLLAQGGFGAVYQGWDDNLGKPIAIKENLDTSPEAQRQVQHEAVTLSNLSHPNLPRVTDHFFIVGLGQYLVMDFVEGEDLQAMLDRTQRPLPEAQVLAWIDQVCDALEYLHMQNPPVIHRDIKPANIKITPQGRAVLVDFGISKIYDPMLRTTLGARAVTPPYSPPEQYGQDITDPRSDIYALGATLYTLLTGQEPPESVLRMSNGLPLTPPRQLVPTLASQIDVAIMRACEVNRTQRYQSARELRQALRPQLQFKPQAAPPSNLPWIIIALGTVLMMAFGLVIYNKINPLPSPIPTTTTPIALISTIALTITATLVPTDTPRPMDTPVPTVTPSPRDPQIRPIDGITMVYVPGGTFTMGSAQSDIEAAFSQCETILGIGQCQWDWFRPEIPQHSVTLDSFWIDQTEISNAQYRLCVEAGKCSALTKCNGGDLTYNDPSKSDHPLVCVNWSEATAYCAWSGGRLPTEAEWEYAARSTNSYIYPQGNTFSGSALNFCDANCSFDWKDVVFNDGYAKTAPVGSFTDSKSWSGALNMAGNVGAWVSDLYGSYSSGAQSNPVGATTGPSRTLKGGSWISLQSGVRLASRSGSLPGSRYDSVGLRCATTGLPGVAMIATPIAPTVTHSLTPVPTTPSADKTPTPRRMVKVLTGTFTMGSDTGEGDESPIHTVFVDGFWIDQYEVTNADFKQFAATGYRTDAENAGHGGVWQDGNWTHPNGTNWRSPYGGSDSIEGILNHPVVQVSWNDAYRYCQWLGKRLPTEAEWEKAARGTDGRIYPYGNEANATKMNSGTSGTTPVGSYRAGISPYGAYDMAGNVWEWVADWYQDDYYASSPGNNPTGPSSGTLRSLRGGGWDQSGGDSRSPDRGQLSPGESGNMIGFRCARSAQ